MGFLGQMHQCRVNCMVQAFRVGDQHTVEASVADIPVEAHGRDIVTCRVARRANMEDRRDLRRLCLDLQVHPR